MKKYLYTIICALIISLLSVGVASGLNKIPFGKEDVVASNTVQEETASAEETSDNSEEDTDEIKNILIEMSQGNAHKYYYAQLNESEKKVYDSLYEAILDVSGNFEIYQSSTGEESGLVLEFELSSDVIEYEKSTADLMDRVYYALRLDHREIFFLESRYATVVDKNDKCVAIKVLCDVAYMSEKNRNQIIINLKKVYDEVMSKTQGKNEYEIVDYIVNYVISTVEYSEDYKKNKDEHKAHCHSLHGLLTKEAVCEGYAVAVNWLAEGAGLDIVYVTGTSDEGENHAWNYLKLNDKYYLLDATWSDDGEICDYSFILIGSIGFGQKYIADTQWKYPELSQTGYYEDMLVFDKSEAYYEEYLYNLISSSVSKINISDIDYEVKESGRYEAERIVIVDKLPDEVSTVEFCKKVYSRYYNENPYNMRFLEDGFVYLSDGNYCKNIVLSLKPEYAKAKNRQ